MSPANACVLIIEDDEAIVRFLRASLHSEEYTLCEAGTGRAGLAQANVCRPDVILLDLGLPDMDGLEVIRRLRTVSATPIIIISARGQESDKVAGLDAGADDYLTKPFGVPELMARIRAALRRVSRMENDSANSVFESGELKVDLVGRIVSRAGREIHVTPIEFRLLAVLVKNAGRVITHGQLLREVWGSHSSEESQYLRVFVHQLRRKVEADPSHPTLILTESGVGYRIKL